MFPAALHEFTSLNRDVATPGLTQTLSPMLNGLGFRLLINERMVLVPFEFLSREDQSPPLQPEYFCDEESLNKYALLVLGSILGDGGTDVAFQYFVYRHCVMTTGKR